MSNSSAMRDQLHRLSRFVMNPSGPADLLDSVADLDQKRFAGFLSLLDKHHILVRVLTPLLQRALATGNSRLAERAQSALSAEHERIQEALPSLEAVCAELESTGCPVVVIKTLEHWPDFGSDLDLSRSQQFSVSK